MSRIDARELLEEARALSASGETETSVARRRTVVNRAYYAAYHACLAVADQLGYDPGDRLAAGTQAAGGRAPGVHGYLIRWLSRFNHRTVQGIGRELGRLKEYRSAADYDDPFSPPSAKDVEFCIRKADQIVHRTCPAALDMILGPRA